MARPLVVDSRVTIPAAEFRLTFARSAGPGGQNVNKVNTKAILRWNVARSSSLPDEVRSRFLQAHSSRIGKSGDVVLSSDRHREQFRNVAACYDRLRQLILAVLQPPQARLKTRPSRAAIRRRLEAKQRASRKKQQRRFRPGADD